MKFYSEKLNRTINLNDNLVNEYLQFEDEIRDTPFAIVVIGKYGHEPTKEEISDEELSELCNRVLASEIKVNLAMPKIIQCIDENYEKFEQASKEGELLEFDIEMGD